MSSCKLYGTTGIAPMGSNSPSAVTGTTIILDPTNDIPSLTFRPGLLTGRFDTMTIQSTILSTQEVLNVIYKDTAEIIRFTVRSIGIPTTVCIPFLPTEIFNTTGTALSQVNKIAVSDTFGNIGSVNLGNKLFVSAGILNTSAEVNPPLSDGYNMMAISGTTTINDVDLDGYTRMTDTVITIASNATAATFNATVGKVYLIRLRALSKLVSSAYGAYEKNYILKPSGSTFTIGELGTGFQDGPTFNVVIVAYSIQFKPTASGTYKCQFDIIRM